MDEYSPKRHDIAQLKFLCETLYHDCLANLEESGNDSNLLIVFYVQIMPDDFVMQLHRF